MMEGLPLYINQAKKLNPECKPHGKLVPAYFLVLQNESGATQLIRCSPPLRLNGLIVTVPQIIALVSLWSQRDKLPFSSSRSPPAYFLLPVSSYYL